MQYEQISRAEIKFRAKDSLKGHWPMAIGATVIVGILSGIFGSINARINFALEVGGDGSLFFASFLTQILAICFISPLTLGILSFFTKISRNQFVELAEVFGKFKTIWLKSIGLNLWISLKILLWSLLLVIPGIIASISYSMAFYIMAEDEQVGINQAVEISKVMMQGYKMQYFVLQLSFIGWAILCSIPCFLGYLWLIPYMQTTMANFYNKVSANYRANFMQN